MRSTPTKTLTQLIFNQHIIYIHGSYGNLLSKEVFQRCQRGTIAQNEQKEIKKSNWRKKYETIHLLSTIIKRITFLFFSYQAFIYFAFYTFLLMNQFLQPQLETNSQKFENNRNLHVESNSNRVNSTTSTILEFSSLKKSSILSIPIC
ncbi:uncharacterized protein LOC116415625 [Apis florea]|uniref:uncharacterized protein LOC116415625 n=1 Tax=Apis florea TaxID=7463 RepID=UPI0012FED535|nr:uncharacterized protein LOC116415625 [Apis florea]